MSPIEELRSRLDQHGARIARVTLDHNPAQSRSRLHRWGPSRTLVQLFEHAGMEIEEWEHWELPTRDAHRLLERYFEHVRTEDNGLHVRFEVSGPRADPLPNR